MNLSREQFSQWMFRDHSDDDRQWQRAMDSKELYGPVVSQILTERLTANMNVHVCGSKPSVSCSDKLGAERSFSDSW